MDNDNLFVVKGKLKDFWKELFKVRHVSVDCIMSAFEQQSISYFGPNYYIFIFQVFIVHLCFFNFLFCDVCILLN